MAIKMEKRRRIQLQVFAYSKRVLKISASHLKNLSSNMFNSQGMLNDEELWIYNPNSGNTAHFKKSETLRDEEENVVGWIMKPLQYDMNKYPRLRDVVINITNE